MTSARRTRATVRWPPMAMPSANAGSIETGKSAVLTSWPLAVESETAKVEIIPTSAPSTSAMTRNSWLAPPLQPGVRAGRPGREIGACRAWVKPDEEQLCLEDEPDGQHALDGNAESVEARIGAEEAVDPLAGVLVALGWRAVRRRRSRTRPRRRSPAPTVVHRPSVAWVRSTLPRMDFTLRDFTIALPN